MSFAVSLYSAPVHDVLKKKEFTGFECFKL